MTEQGSHGPQGTDRRPRQEFLLAPPTSSDVLPVQPQREAVIPDQPHAAVEPVAPAQPVRDATTGRIVGARAGASRFRGLVHDRVHALPPVRRRDERKRITRERRAEFAVLKRKLRDVELLSGKEADRLVEIYTAEQSKMKKWNRAYYPTRAEAVVIGPLGTVAAVASALVEGISNPAARAAAEVLEISALGVVTGLGMALDYKENIRDPLTGDNNPDVTVNVTKGHYGRRLAVMAGIPVAEAVFKAGDAIWNKVVEHTGEGPSYVHALHTVVDVFSAPADPKLLPGYLGLVTGATVVEGWRRGLQNRRVRNVERAITTHNELNPSLRRDLPGQKKEK